MRRVAKRPKGRNRHNGAKAAEGYLHLQCSERALHAAARSAADGHSDREIFSAFIVERATAMLDQLFIEDNLKKFCRRVSYV
jgi:hypothetical protein